MKYDLIVIGGGPAGMMAAGTAAQSGARVLLLEKNKELGVKLLITGKGRCNLTTANYDIKSFIEKFGKNGRFLFSALDKFSIEDTIKFFEERGLKTSTERGERIFVGSGKAVDLKNILISYLRDNNVNVKTGAEVKSIIKTKNKINKIVLVSSEEFIAENYLICTGGKSYPVTGSTGDGYKWLRDLGHTIVNPRPALVPIIAKDKFIKELEGLSLKNVEISIYQNNKKHDSRFGEALFTDKGMSGPIIIDMSRKIGELLSQGAVEIWIDFKPALDFETFDKRIQKDFAEARNKLFRNSLGKLFPKKTIPVIIGLSGINPDKKVNEITKQERKKLLHLTKEFKIQVKGTDGFDKAIITTGGVSLKEIDSKTLKSKIIDNLYLAGEVLDLDGPTGGFNLQVCWSTGYTAGANFKK